MQDRDFLLAELDRVTAELKDARFEAWDDWMLEFGDGLDRFGGKWEDLKGDLPVTEAHGIRMAQSFCILKQDRDYWQARAEKAEDFLRDEGFRTCDIPACNCCSWHWPPNRRAEKAEARTEDFEREVLRLSEALGNAEALFVECTQKRSELADALRRIAGHHGHNGCEPMATPDECLEHVERLAEHALASIEPEVKP